MKDQPIKLQLNSEAAIRSIIDGDPELQIEIKNKISCAIAKGYERIDKEVVDNSVNRLYDIVKQSVYNDLTEQVKDGYNYKTYLKPETRILIGEKVKSEIDLLIYQEVDKAKEELKVLIKDRVDLMAKIIVYKTTNEIFENSVRSEVIRRYDMMQEAIDKEIQEEQD